MSGQFSACLIWPRYRGLPLFFPLLSPPTTTSYSVSASAGINMMSLLKIVAAAWIKVLSIGTPSWDILLIYSKKSPSIESTNLRLSTLP